MLLPSALDCAPGIQPIRSIYTTDTMLSPPPSHRQSINSPANVFSTCRALQSLITTNLTPPPTIAKPSYTQTSLASPIILAPDNRKRSAQTPQPSTSTNAPQPKTPPPASRKRRRSDSDNENRPPPNQNQNQVTTLPSTPKRQRLCPPTLPLGLSRADFSALQAEAAAIPIPSTPLRRRHHLPTHQNKTSTPTPTSPSSSSSASYSPDSHALISLILQKLHLSQSDWDSCAHGKNNSIGEHFRILLGNEGVGLRRGGGKRRRKSVVGMEFGPLLGG